MEEQIQKDNIAFNKETQDEFFIYLGNQHQNTDIASTNATNDNFHCLTLLYEGSITHFADWDKNVITGPALILNNDQLPVNSDFTGCKVISIAFSSDFVYGQREKSGNYLEAIFSEPHILLAAHELELIDRYIQLICYENERADGKKFQIIGLLINALIIRCAKFIDVNEKVICSKKNIFLNFKYALEKNYRSNHQVGFYADKLNVTTEVLTDAVKRVNNKTPKQMINERLLFEAKKYLHWSDITVREIAWELGFETDGYFNRFFKKFAGTTPKEFQKKAP